METRELEDRLGTALKRAGYRLATAESCTGGLVGHLITNVPGSSDYYLGGVTAYSNEIKQALLGVRPDTLDQFGAVSQETVIEMARGVRARFSAVAGGNRVIGVSVSGIAGPGGAMPGKPVGLVWIGLSTPDGEAAYRYVYAGGRVENKESSARQALQLVLDYLSADELPSG
ncbi:MAG TPA: CinA family protein [Anaerolineaceae bacterium]|nr:CinA family protein [Anaerolineaceae bacterium]